MVCYEELLWLACGGRDQMEEGLKKKKINGWVRDQVMIRGPNLEVHIRVGFKIWKLKIPHRTRKQLS